jgi:ubiquinone/menaquinone biosynthesis C-methylase UbiE
MREALSRKLAAVLLGGAALVAGSVVVWAMGARRDPSACPFGQRFFLDLPRPFLRRETLRALLTPVPGERILEVGPGTGYYSLAVARLLGPGGRLEVLDVQPAMLDELMRRAATRGIANIVPKAGDAARLPYPDATFDAVYLVATLGEIAQRNEALCELRRVVKPGGRVVIGEGQPDPHMISSLQLQEMAAAAELRVERQAGNRFGYLVRLHPV